MTSKCLCNRRGNCRGKYRGNIAVSLILVVFVTIVGLMLLSFSITHTRIVKARTQKLTIVDHMYQDFVYYLHHFRQSIFLEDLRPFPEPESEYFTNSYFPAETFNGNLIEPSFQWAEIPPKTGTALKFKKSRVTASFKITRPGTGYILSSGVTIEILSGDIPLSYFPFSTTTSLPLQDTLEKNNITTPGKKAVKINKEDISFSMADFLLKALKINATVLGWRQIREICGLPDSDDPLPDGVYIALDPTIPAVLSIFVQGDIDRLEFGAKENEQIIRIDKDSTIYQFIYQPGSPGTRCWDTNVPTHSTFEEKIIVNGNIREIRQAVDCNAAFLPDSRLSLSVSGKSVFKSNLDTETGHLNVNKTNFANLTVTCAKDQLFNNGENSEITIDTNETTNLSASLLTNGKITNKSKNLKVKGSIHCNSIENQGEKIEIKHSDSNNETDNFFTAKNLKILHNFVIQYIEEVPYEGN